MCHFDLRRRSQSNSAHQYLKPRKINYKYQLPFFVSALIRSISFLLQCNYCNLIEQLVYVENDAIEGWGRCNNKALGEKVNGGIRRWEEKQFSINARDVEKWLL